MKLKDWVVVMHTIFHQSQNLKHLAPNTAIIQIKYCMDTAIPQGLPVLIAIHNKVF